MHYINARSILSASNGMNIYRGCAHGCIYCDARSVCYGMKHDFEDIQVKINAPELLEKALASKRKKCMISTGAMSDPYQPLERSLGLTRQCLQVVRDHGFGIALQTKSPDILRDMDLLTDIHRRARCVVQMTLTTADPALCRLIEPNVADTQARFRALMEFHRAGIPVAVWITPLLPFINDTPENLSALLDMCEEAGASAVLAFNMGLTLRDGDREYYYRALDRHFPGLRSEYVRRYGNAYELPSPRARELWRIFDDRCRKRNILHPPEEVFSWLARWPEPSPVRQISLFDSDF